MNLLTLQSPSWRLQPLTRLWPVLITVAVAACGGGGDADTVTDPASGGTLSSAPVSAITAMPVTAAPVAVASVSLNPGSTCNLANFQAELLQHINTARAAGRSCGATAFAPTTALAWNAKLFAAAEGHSRDMAVNNYFSHTALSGRTASQRVTDAGYVWRATGENIAAGQRDVSTVMNGWLASDGHCRNIMNPAYQDVAVACVQQAGSTYGRYWTMVLARP